MGEVLMSSLNTKYVTVELSEINCGECGGTYAINEHYREQMYQKGGSWNCPYCSCGWGYSQNNENSKLKKQIETLERSKKFAERQAANEREEAKYQKNCARAQKAAKTRIKNRIKNGVCPCCNRTFKQLAAHMKNKHPDYMEHK